ncbi:MAG TPA: 2-C-methyl-D-erythritol 4-phosphate cytidylyltransferase [Candidatus Tumulicola sp.]|nr:2-C-methyl-D-erythritol 4-phosphate cytidylyltransferase [Candidatus Tumulicola sp.]
MPQAWAAVIVAAGRGQRFGGPKQFVPIAGLPMAGWSIRTFAAVEGVVDLIVVTEPEWIERMGDLIARIAPQTASAVVAGGATRQESVRSGVQAVPQRCDGVFVHDGARPLVRGDDVRAAMRVVSDGCAALLAAPVVDTIKCVDPANREVIETLDRHGLWAAQTPQFATTADMARAHERARRDGIEATDDAALLERAGIVVRAIEASSENFKVTHPHDVARAETMLLARLAETA